MEARILGDQANPPMAGDLSPWREGDRAKVFVSYSRKDVEAAEMLAGALATRGFEAYLDRTDIAPGEPWQERLTGLIAASDTVVFVVSPDSVSSSVCAWEIEESFRLGKKLIPVVARRIADGDAPAALGRLNWVFCTQGDDRAAALASLDLALRTDLGWVREHTRLGELARRWQRQGKTAGLRGAELEAAERWLDGRPAASNAPTALHQDFIRASRRAATARQRRWAGASLVAALVAAGLAGWAEINRREAKTQAGAAEMARSEAQAQRDEAQARRDQAIHNQVAALAALSSASLETSPARAAKLALAAWPRDASDRLPQLDVVTAALSSSVQSLRERKILRGHKGGVSRAVFSPDGSHILTVSDDKTARLWEAASGKEIAVLEGQESLFGKTENRVNSAAFSPDGVRIVTASAGEGCGSGRQATDTCSPISARMRAGPASTTIGSTVPCSRPMGLASSRHRGTQPRVSSMLRTGRRWSCCAATMAGSTAQSFRPTGRAYSPPR
jgi:hypothetical protein